MEAKTERIHALDALRAVMMLLGIVIHSTTIYGKIWTVYDADDYSPFLAEVCYVIGLFRMPVFYLVSGFFSALLWHDRSPQKMIKNRWKRIVLPFCVFVFVLWWINRWAYYYALQHLDSTYQAGMDMYYLPLTWNDILPKATFHLWFLYYLILFNIVAIITAKYLKVVNKIRLNTLSKWGGFIALFITIVLIFTKQDWVHPPMSFIPKIDAFLFYGLFYGVGWQLFHQKALFQKTSKYYKPFLGIATVFIFVKILFFSNADLLIKLPLNLGVAICLIFGVIGFFFANVNTYSAKWRYISDASYWVYLAHLPMCIVLPVWMDDWSIHVAFKFLIEVMVTTIVCFVSYHYLVRSTFIGAFLNGRRY